MISSRPAGHPLGGICVIELKFPAYTRKIKFIKSPAIPKKYLDKTQIMCYNKYVCICIRFRNEKEI